MKANRAIAFPKKLGTTKAGERTRIWIEGERLAAQGWKAGDHFHRSWDKKLRSLTLLKITTGEFSLLARDERGTVSGKKDRPIIDIAGQQVAEFFRGEQVSIVYGPRRILISEER